MLHKSSMTLLLVLGLCCSAGAANVYVDASATAGANDGTSWENAFVDLHSPGPFPGGVGDTIKIAKGTYQVSPTNPDAAIYPSDGVTVEGGYMYTGTEEIRSVSHTTTITADVNMDDTDLPDLWLNAPINPNVLFDDTQPGGSRYDNGNYIFHIPTGYKDITIDGLTLISVNGRRVWYGCAIGIRGTNITVRNCTISGCTSDMHGVGMVVESGGTALIEDCLFTQNEVHDTDWGSVFRIGGPDGTVATVRNCVFFRNVHSDMMCAGLGVHKPEGNAAYIYDCVFFQNWGGCALGHRSYPADGVVTTDQSIMEIYNCVVIGNMNKGTVGGGWPYPSTEAGALWLFGSGQTVHSVDNMVTLVKNCLIADNGAANGPNGEVALAGLSILRKQTATVINCTVVNNQGPSANCHGIRVRPKPNLVIDYELKNTITWGNAGADHKILTHTINPEAGTTNITCTYNCIDDTDGDPNNYTIGLGNITPASLAFADSAYHLSPGAASIDTGDPDDSVGSEPKCNGGLINMGAYGGTVNATPTVPGAGTMSGDINCDGEQNLADFQILAGQWLQ